MSDNAWIAVTTLICAQVASIVAAILGYLKSRNNSDDIKALHVVVNSRLTELLVTTKAAALAEGQLAGAESQRLQGDRTAADIIDAAKLQRDQGDATGMNTQALRDNTAATDHNTDARA